MKKIVTIYLIGTLLPILLFLIEKKLPYYILKDITILSNEILNTSYKGLFTSVLLIVVGSLIIMIFTKNKQLNFNIILSNGSIKLITFYALYRFISAVILYYKFGNLYRSEIQLIEGTSRYGLVGIIIQFLNSLFPILVTIVASSYFSFNTIHKRSSRFNYKKFILFLQILFLGFSSLMVDLARGSRGNITFFGISLIIGYLITSKEHNSILKNKNKITALIVSFSLVAMIIGSTYFRSAKVYRNDISINTEEKIANVGLIKILHDSTIAKAIGGQLITNKAINGDLYLTSSIENHISLSREYTKNLISKRDNYCKRFDCLHLFQPIHKLVSIFGYSKDVLPIYIAFDDEFPFNSTSHLGSIYLIYRKNIAPFIYLILIYLNIKLIKSKSNYLQFGAVFNIYYFSIFAFTDNWFVSLYPYISISFMFLLKSFNIKILNKK